MQMKNVNLLQSSEAASTSKQSTAGPPLPPRASSQLCRPLPGPPSVPNNQHRGTDDPSHIYSPYKSVPVPKPIPPPYRQPPFPNPQYATCGQRLNNDPLISMPGSTDNPDNGPNSPVYVTHSSKFPIKQEPARPHTASHAEGSSKAQQRIPHLAEVVRQQRPRTANTVTPDPGPQPLAHQAWTENERHGKETTIKRAALQEHPWEESSNRVLFDGNSMDEGERLLVRSRSGPLYPLGIDNKSIEGEEPGYVPSQPHQRLDGARGQALMERRPNPIPVISSDAPLYRAHFVTTDDPAVALPQRGNLRDTCLRLYTKPSSPAIHSSMQNFKGSMLSLHSATGRLQVGGAENPYATKEEALACEQAQHSLYEAHGGTVPPPQQFRTTAEDVSSAVDTSGPVHDDSVRSAYESNGPGPQHRYYHLKDMMSGPTAEDPAVSNVIDATETAESLNDHGIVVREDGPASNNATAAASEEEERVYGAVKRGAIYGVLQQQQQFSSLSVRNIAQKFQKSRIESGEEQSKVEPANVVSATVVDTQNVQSDGVAVSTCSSQLPVSPSAVSTSSESGRGTMPMKSGESPISGTLNTSFESDVGGRSRIASTATIGANTDLDTEKRPQTVAKSSATVGGTVPQPSVRQCIGIAKWTDTAESELRQILDAKMHQKPRDRGTGASDCISVRRSDRHSVHDTTFSDSFSITPPLPPLSPLDTPPSLHSRNSKYKLSLSAGNLHKSSGMTPDILETTRRGPSQNSKEANMRILSKKAALKGKLTSGSQDSRSWSTAKKYTPQQSRVPVSSVKNSSLYASCLRGSEISLGAIVSHDGEVTSTTTGLDMDSLLGDGDLSTDDGSSQTSQAECGSEINNIRQQLEGLEAMYSEVMRVLGVKGAPSNQLAGQRSLHDLRPSKRRVFGSLTSLTGKVGRAATGATKERTGQHHERKKNRESKSVGRRFQRLESHVVTLARSVAHLSSEMRTQHIMFQELESLRQEVAQLHEQQGLLRGGGGKCAHGGGHRGGANVGVAGREWDNFRSTIPSLTNPVRIKKLTKFFGDEPPLLRLFLKKLGYEKYAPQFEAEKIGIIELPYLTEERLQKVGIPMGPRMRILQEAQMSFRQEHFNIYIV